MKERRKEDRKKQNNAIGDKTEANGSRKLEKVLNVKCCEKEKRDEGRNKQGKGGKKEEKKKEMTLRRMGE